MKSATIFHDAFSDPASDWYSWMKTMLEAMGYFVAVPKFPTPAGQSLDSWEAAANPYAAKWDSDTIVIGHGAGGAFALRMVENAGTRIHGLFLVAGYAEKIGHAGFDRVNESFFAKPFDFEKIKMNAMVIESFSGAGDPFVPAALSEELAKNLGVENNVIPDGGHVTRADGFTQCVPVLAGIKDAMGNLEKNITIAPVAIEPIAANIPTPPSLAPTHPQPPLTEGAAPARTMYQDMSELVNSNSGKVASSLLSKGRQDEAEKEAVSPKSTKNIFYILGALIAIAVALGIIGYVLYENAPAATLATDIPLTSLILADSHVKIELHNQTPYGLASAIRETLAKPVADATIRDIVYADQTTREPIASVLSVLDISAPQSFSDELNDPAWMDGEASFNGTTSHFIAIPILHYDSAFSGLRDWEPTMVRDLGIFFGLSDSYLKTMAGTGAFQDAMIENHPVRALYYHAKATITLDESDAPAINMAPSPYQDGDLMLAYFFINEHTLIIADSTAIIPQILERYQNSQIYK